MQDTLRQFKADFFQALAHPTRIAIVEQLRDGELSAGALIDRLGIAAAVNARAVVIPMGFTAAKVASGEADLAIQQISELMSVPGIDVVGPFPGEVQTVSTFDAAIFTDAANPQGASALLEVLTSPAAAQAYADGGLVSRLAAR